jgi:transposase
MTRHKAGTGSRRERRAFSDEFKQEAVRMLRERRAIGVSVTQIGRELDVRPDQLRAWAQQQERAGGSVRTGTGETLEQEVRRLRREVETLRQEREFAKKAAAFFARGSR